VTFLELCGVVALFALATRGVIAISWFLYGSEHAEGD
jgi:hypothetical protein